MITRMKVYEVGSEAAACLQRALICDFSRIVVLMVVYVKSSSEGGSDVGIGLLRHTIPVFGQLPLLFGQLKKRSVCM